jgi:hypothetical protein
MFALWGEDNASTHADGWHGLLLRRVLPALQGACRFRHTGSTDRDRFAPEREIYGSRSITTMERMTYGKYQGTPIEHVPLWALHWECRHHRFDFSEAEHAAMLAEIRRREYSIWAQRRRDAALMRRGRTR